MTTQERIAEIRRILNAHYPHVKTQLNFETPFQLLVATILSAQCTDKQVNAVTPKLFEVLNTPQNFAEAPLETIESLVRSTGFYKNKAKNLQKCSSAIVERFGGEVPDNLDDLVSLPGVGRKTANVVLGAVHGIPGIVVDTHVARISRRLDMTRHTDPEKIERHLMAVIPEPEWNDFSHRLIYFGREICMARKPACDRCFLNQLCYAEDKWINIP